MKLLALAALLVVGCAPERPATGILHDPGEHRRQLAEIEAEAARKRDLAADEATRAAIERRRAEKEEEARQAKLELAARCAAQRRQRDAALAELDAEVTAAAERLKRRQTAETWIKARCRVYAEKETAAELWTDGNGKVHRREVVTGVRGQFQACPAKTPQHVIDDGGLRYDDDYGWTRHSVAPMPPTPEDVRAAHQDAIAKIVSADCPADSAPPTPAPP